MISNIFHNIITGVAGIFLFLAQTISPATTTIQVLPQTVTVKDVATTSQEIKVGLTKTQQIKSESSAINSYASDVVEFKNNQTQNDINAMNEISDAYLAVEKYINYYKLGVKAYNSRDFVDASLNYQSASAALGDYSDIYHQRPTNFDTQKGIFNVVTYSNNNNVINSSQTNPVSSGVSFDSKTGVINSDSLVKIVSDANNNSLNDKISSFTSVLPASTYTPLNDVNSGVINSMGGIMSKAISFCVSATNGNEEQTGYDPIANQDFEKCVTLANQVKTFLDKYK